MTKQNIGFTTEAERKEWEAVADQLTDALVAHRPNVARDLYERFPHLRGYLIELMLFEWEDARHHPRAGRQRDAVKRKAIRLAKLRAERWRGLALLAVLIIVIGKWAA